MTSRVNLALCIIFIAWISVSGKLYTFNNLWQGEMERCDNEGGGNHEYHFDIGTLNSVKLSYDALNNETVITASGKMVFNSTILGHREERSMILNAFKDMGDSKTYSNYLGIAGTIVEEMQMGTVEMTLIVNKTGPIALNKIVYAESWKSKGCSRVDSSISNITIEV